MSTTSKKILSGLAAAIGTSALVTSAPGPAGAEPTYVPCLKWSYTGTLTIDQDNDLTVYVPWRGTFAGNGGDATLHKTGTGETVNHGPASGGIENGTQINLTIHWYSPGGINNHYQGTIENQFGSGVARGSTTNTQGVKNDWVARETFECLELGSLDKSPADNPPANNPPANNPPAPSPPGGTINAKVDLYDVPGGDGIITGHLDVGDKVTFNGPCPMKNPANDDDKTNGWCNITDTTKKLTGSVWGDFITK